MYRVFCAPAAQQPPRVICSPLRLPTVPTAIASGRKWHSAFRGGRRASALTPTLPRTSPPSPASPRPAGACRRPRLHVSAVRRTSIWQQFKPEDGRAHPHRPILASRCWGRTAAAAGPRPVGGFEWEARVGVEREGQSTGQGLKKLPAASSQKAPEKRSAPFRTAGSHCQRPMRRLRRALETALRASPHRVTA